MAVRWSSAIRSQPPSSECVATIYCAEAAHSRSEQNDGALLALHVLGGDVDTGVAKISKDAGELHAVPDPE